MRVLVPLLVAHTLLCALTNALDDLPLRARGGKAWAERQAVLKVTASESEGFTWQAPLDHFDETNNATYTQHYFVDDQYFDASDVNAPVFFMIGGEGPMNSAPAGYMATLAADYSALLVSLEHRYYGNSIPDSIEDPMETENLEKYLTVEQALADLASFTDYYRTSVNENTADRSWFVFGGSYPGALASWYRTAYPEHSVGSLSSSGVVNCIIDYSDFDKAVSAAIGNSCSDQIKKVNSAFERMAKTPSGWSKALQMFNCESDMWKQDFFYMIADSWSMVDQYSAKSKLCQAIDAPPEVPDERVAEMFASFSNEYWGEDFCQMGFYNTEQLSDPERWEPNSRSWRWQTCSQVSYFNTAPSSGSLRSSSVNLGYHLRQCEAAFGKKVFPSSVDMNKRYGGGEPVASKVFYSDFSDDPWQRASVDYPVSSDQPYHLTTCDNCGHCLDLHQPYDDDPQALKDGRAEFETYLSKWLNDASAAREERKKSQPLGQLKVDKDDAECLPRGDECFRGDQCCSGRCSGDGVTWTCA